MPLVDPRNDTGIVRNVARWLRADLRGVQSPRRIARTLRTHPTLWLSLVLDILVVGALFLAVLVALGRTDSVLDWAQYPVLLVGGMWGEQVAHARKRAAGRPDDRLRVSVAELQARYPLDAHVLAPRTGLRESD